MGAGIAPALSASEGFFEKRITCGEVRLALKRFDAATLEAAARAKGLSEATIERLKRCPK